MSQNFRALRLPDTGALTKRTSVFSLQDGSHVRVDVLGEHLFRIRQSVDGRWTESALNRYGILQDGASAGVASRTETFDDHVDVSTGHSVLSVDLRDGHIRLRGECNRIVTETLGSGLADGGCRLRFRLSSDECIYGLGDSSRENIMRRGSAYEIWVLNVLSYIPIPMVLSSCGWGAMLNSTWHHYVDVGKTVSDVLDCRAPLSDVDYYVFTGNSLSALLDVYTSFTGRPAVLPIWAYSLAYVCHQEVDAFQMMNEASEMRRQNLPCDIIGLEPGWMSKYYDFSTKKDWDQKKFTMPYWLSQPSEHTFLGALKRLGYKLSLWQCCDYDLSVAEENAVKESASPCYLEDVTVPEGQELPDVNPLNRKGLEDAVEQDTHLDGFKETDGAPEAVDHDRGEDTSVPWYEHWKRFAQQGARAFKLDGSNQVNLHPGRAWGNGMCDQQMHNLYPLLLDKQMSTGYEAQCNRRSMVYSASGYAGIQRYVASWAGDTGGGPKTLASMLNLGLSGHSNHSCDMDVFTHEGIHFGFLQSWSQLNNWIYWRQPWYLPAEDLAVFRYYDKLRNRLLPYLYSSAHEAGQCGLPMMRSMPLSFPEETDRTFDLTQYMLGGNLLVTAYTDRMKLPGGRWLNWWTKSRETGPEVKPAAYPQDRGGCLYLREGAIVPLWPYQDHVEKGFHEDLELIVFPGRHASSFVLFEDDGESLEYRQGKLGRTHITCSAVSDQGVTVIVAPREGCFEGMNATRNLCFSLYVDQAPRKVSMNGDACQDWKWDGDSHCLTLSLPGVSVESELKLICEP